MNKKLKLALFGALLLSLLAAIGFYAAQRNPSDRLVSVQQGPLTETISETAELLAYERAAIYTESPQTIATVHAVLGQTVTAGEVLLTYQNTHDLKLAQLQAQRQATAAQLDGQLAAAHADLSRLSSAHLEAQKRYERQRTLYEAGALSSEALETAETALQKAQEDLAAAQSALSSLKRQQQSQLAQIDASLGLLAQEHQSAVITAPFDGIITECPYSAGAHLPMGTLVLEVQNPNRLYLQSELLSEDAARLQEGTAVRAVQKDYGQTLDGLTVSQIAPKAHAATSSLGAEQRRLPVTIALPAGALPVPLGTQWDVTFTLADIADALWLPKACVYTRGQDSVVLLPDGRTERPVTTGIRQGDRIEIVEGLEEGDQVLLPK